MPYVNILELSNAEGDAGFVRRMTKGQCNMVMTTYSFLCAKSFMPVRLEGTLSSFGTQLHRLGFFEQDEEGVPYAARHCNQHTQFPFRRGTPDGNAHASWADFKANPAEKRPLQSLVMTYSSENARKMDTPRLEVPITVDETFCRVFGERYVRAMFGCDVSDPRIASVQVFVEKNGAGVTSYYNEVAGEEAHIHVGIVFDAAAALSVTSIKRRFANLTCTCLRGLDCGVFPTLDIEQHLPECEPRRHAGIERDRGAISTRQHAWTMAPDGRLVDSPQGVMRQFLDYSRLKKGKGVQEPIAFWDGHKLLERIMPHAEWNFLLKESTGVVIPKALAGKMTLLRTVEMCVKVLGYILSTSRRCKV